MSVAVTWPGSNGTAFSGTLWSTSTYNNVGAAGADTFTVQSAKGRIACVAGAGDSKQQARYVHSNGNHSTTFQYRGTITWSAVGGEATNFLVRSDNVVVANSNYCANCYVFEFDNVANTIVCYKVTASTPAVITSAPAAAPFTFVAGTVYNVLFDLSGYVLGVKIWTGSEPGPYTYTVTDPDSSINSATVGKFAWTNYHLPTTVTDIDIGDATFTSNKWVEATAGAPASVGTAHFESTGGSTSLTLTATSAVTAAGTANNASTKASTRLGTPPTAVGAAYNAGVNVGATTGVAVALSDDSTLTYATDPLASISSLTFDFVTGSIGLFTPSSSTADTAATTTLALAAGAAHNATTRSSGKATPTAATSTGTANAAAVTAVSANIVAECATGVGVAGGVSFLLDENGDPVLDENGQPVEDGVGLTVHVAPHPAVVTAAGAANTATTKVATGISAAVSVGSAPQPSINATGTGPATNVNAAAATGSGAANAATSTVSLGAVVAASTGAVTAAQSSIGVNAGGPTAVGVAYPPDSGAHAEAALVSAVAYDPQVDVLANNFAPVAAIPIAGSAENANIHIAVNAGINVAVGRAWPANQSVDIPGQLVTVRDQGHTVTVKER